jgi:hypothetical protein
MMKMDIKRYYMGTPLPRYDYMRMLLSRFLKKLYISTTLRHYILMAGYT